MSDYKIFLLVREGLRELWKKGELINAIIKTDDGQQFRAHWEILVAFSPYLERLLVNSAMPYDDPLRIICVPDVKGVTMSTVISCAYDRKILISASTVESLIRAAMLLEIPSMTNIGIKFLASHIDEDSCVQIYKFGKMFQNEQLLLKASKFLLTSFEKIYATSEDFLKLDREDIEEMLRSDYLNVSNEENAFKALMRWTDYEPEVRRHYVASLLGYIRFGFCALEFYQRHVATNPYIVENQDCQTVLFQTSMLYVDMNGGQSGSRPIDLHHPLIRPRIPYELIFAIGGWSNGSATNVIESYDMRGGRWFLSNYVDTMPRAYHGLIAVGGVIYMIGGFDGNQCFNTVRCFDVERRSWYERACMYVARCYISVATVNEQIYAMGGYDGHTRVNTAERYEVETNQWHLIRNMHQIRSDASATAVDGKIFIAGGFNGQQVLNSCEFYEPETDVWTVIAEMSSPRSGVNLIAYEDTIYVIGGFNGTNRLSSVEKFDMRMRQWSPIAPMTIPRSNFATAIIEGQLFVIGGFNGLTTVSSVESYSSSSGTWTPVADMNVNRSALAACVMKGLSNNRDFCFIGHSQNSQ